MDRTLTPDCSLEDFETVDFEQFSPLDRYKFMTTSSQLGNATAQCKRAVGRPSTDCLNLEARLR